MRVGPGDVDGSFPVSLNLKIIFNLVDENVKRLLTSRAWRRFGSAGHQRPASVPTGDMQQPGAQPRPDGRHAGAEQGASAGGGAGTCLTSASAFTTNTSHALPAGSS